MTHYLVAYRDFFKEITVTTHPSRESAGTFGQLISDKDSHYSSVVLSDDNDPDLGGPGLVSLYGRLVDIHNSKLEGDEVANRSLDPVKKFESRGVGKRRVFELVEQLYQYQPEEAVTATPSSDTPPGPQSQAESPDIEQENDMTKTTKQKRAKKVKAPKEKKERAPRGKGKAAGKVADFRPVREGTDRQKVLKLMNGSNTAEQIGAELGMPAKKIGTIVFCMSRDNGIGYEFGAKGQLKALFPGDNTYKDAVKKTTAE